MKLRMEFEESDVRDMIESYFERNGFKVKNIDSLCMQFLEAYPDGIQVDVQTLPIDNEPIENVVEDKEEMMVKESPPSVETEEEDQEVTKSSGNTRLSMSDIMDPTPGVHNVPSRDELLKMREQEQKELQHLLNESKTIESEKQ